MKTIVRYIFLEHTFDRTISPHGHSNNVQLGKSVKVLHQRVDFPYWYKKKSNNALEDTNNKVSPLNI